jgi:hypothetical protein
VIPKADQWPIGDAWAYHDWHQSGNGEIEPFMQAIETQFGAGTSLADFERKAQMLQYVEHRAIFEGMDQHLWAPNSGRMLWMTQPAWPSNMWQIISSEYDTQSSFYGVKKACEPVHVQLDLSDFGVAAVNTTTTAQPGATVTANVYWLTTSSRCSTRKERCGANAMTPGFKLTIPPDGTAQLVKLELVECGGAPSDNLYWLGATGASYRAESPAVPTLATSATFSRARDRACGVPQNTGGQSGVAEQTDACECGRLRILPALQR